MSRKRRRTNRQRSSSTEGFTARYYRSNTRKRDSAVPGWKMGAACVCMLGVIGAVWIFGRVETVEVTGTNDTAIKNELTEQIQRDYTFLWEAYTRSPGKTLVYPDMVADVDVSPRWRNQQLVAAVTMHQPAVLWRTGDTVYAVGREGYVLRNVSDPDKVDAPLVHDASDLPTEVGEHVVPEHFISFTRRVADADLSITRLRIINTTSELYADLAGGYYVRFDTTGSAKTQLENVMRVQQTARDQGETIDQYIDVRLPYKAYYK